MPGRLETGIEVLDRKLEGGIPAGSIVVLSAQPASQAELFLYELTATRGTLWLSLNRTAEAVTESIANTPTETGDPTVRHITGEAPLDKPENSSAHSRRRRISSSTRWTCSNPRSPLPGSGIS
jgi:RecA-superfamily ATPases implicated in signal transduction